MPLSSASCLPDHSPHVYYTSARKNPTDVLIYCSSGCVSEKLYYWELNATSTIAAAAFCGRDDVARQPGSAKVATLFESLSAFVQKHIFQPQLAPTHLRGVSTSERVAEAALLRWMIPPPGL